MFRRRPRLGPLITKADAARDRRDWAAACAGYARILSYAPTKGPLWVQYGHSLMELGRTEEALAAYARAAALAPDDADVRLHRAHALKQLCRQTEAADAYESVLAVDPGNHHAQHELIALGLRTRVAEDARRIAVARADRDAAGALRAAAEALDRAARLAPHPLRDWDGFCRDFPIAPPPGRSAGEMLVEVDGRGVMPALLRGTLLSLIDQSEGRWRCDVLSDPGTAAQPIGSLAHSDPRIRFVAEPRSGAGPRLMVLGGTCLHPHALAWFGHATASSDAAAAYCDFDHGRTARYGEVERFLPMLQGMFDPDFIAAAAEPPVVVLTGRPAPLDQLSPAERFRAALLGAAGPVAHIPRVLATVMETPADALNGTVEPSREWPAPAARARTGGDDIIQVIVPTRDEPAILGECLDSFRSKAARSDKLDLLVVDNRSLLAETAELLARGRTKGTFRHIPFDEPFNWSRANAAGVAAGDAPLILFANNDMTMLSEGWDDRVREGLADPAVGAVGARLLYPNGTVQHAGVLLGAREGLPTHEGLGDAADDAGPMARSRTRRSVAAATGAFLALRRRDFEAVGGFEETELMVAYNDVDMCFRLRAQGLRILYEPAIELIHHESLTRGRDRTVGQIAWEMGERASLFRRWGEWVSRDPSYNPQWSRRGMPFDGFREPPPSEILEHIRASAVERPWTVTPASDERGPGPDAASRP